MKEKKNLQGCSINNHKSRPQEYGVENFVATQHLKQQTWFQTVTKKKNLKWVTEGEKWNTEYDWDLTLIINTEHVIINRSTLNEKKIQ